MEGKRKAREERKEGWAEQVWEMVWSISKVPMQRRSGVMAWGSD